MKNTTRSEYAPHDFRAWQAAGTLNIAPKFQRRGVWSTPAKSYLMDTLIREMPVPPVYLRVVQSADKTKLIREVVDGQQRISAVLDFISGKYKLASSLDSPHAGKVFKSLPPEAQDAVLQYPFICEVLQGVSDQEVLEIFSRLNQYSVPLNEQELRNGTYFGFFKQSAYRLAYEHVEFWKLQGIFSDQKIARMMEVEFTSELLIAELAGMQDKKKSISDFYQKYDQSFPERAKIEDRFRKTIDAISASVGDELRASPFKRTPLFYSLFCAVFHRQYGLPGEKLPTIKKAVTDDDREKLTSALALLSDSLEQFADDVDLPLNLRKFAIACSGQSDNIDPLRVRMSTIYSLAFL